MQEIAHGVYFETAYPGVTLGAICLAHGQVLVDAPPRLDDARAWRSELTNLGGGVERLLVNLDAHFDRTLGVRGMECTVAAHENTAQIFRNRSNTFKAQTGTSGADWEQLGGLGSIRWAAPDLSFTDRLTLFWGETSINLENHPGPQPGAIWLAAPEAQVIFVGDLLTPNQPPFLATADIPAWMDALDLLSGPQYADFQIVGGRSGLVPVEAIFQQKEILSVIQDHLTRLQNQAAPVEEIEGIIPVVMEMLDVPGSHVEQYQQRLRWGLTHAYNCACQAELADGSSVE